MLFLCFKINFKVQRIILILIFSITILSVHAQTGVIKGKVTNSINKEPLPFINVVIDGTINGATTDIDGNYQINNLMPGIYNVKASGIGYKTLIQFEIQVNNKNAVFVNFALDESQQDLQEVNVTAQQYVKKEESPVSLVSIGAAEIKRNPGANRDISKVIQSLPGVAVSSSFRNDIIVRGGSPIENRFYIDGIEVPTINHFNTQGASGGPVGLINVDFVEDLDFYSGAFPANRGNSLSSVLDFKFKEARTDKPAFSITLSATDLAATVETPLTKNSTLIASWRRSYLQFLFAALELPFLPKYDDFQFKNEIKLDSKNIIDIIGIGAIDNLTLNTAANKTPEQQYILAQIPTNKQWNYTIGGTWRHFKENSYTTYVISRNHLDNTATKYENNDESNPANLILNYNSTETENKVRVEETIRKNGWKINYGAGMEYATYTTTTFQKLAKDVTLNYSSDIGVVKYGFFGQVSKGVFKESLQLSLGLRLDGNDFNDNMANPFNQLSPRFSASYRISEKISLNFNTGMYNQMPAYTILGFRDSAGALVNTDVKYLKANHIVFGVEYATQKNTILTIEGFYKGYSNYPFNLIDSISLANQGSDFGVIGNTPVISNNMGRAYGFEIFLQQKLYKNFYGLVSYTFVRSEFQDINGNYVPSAWDYRNMISITFGKIFKKGWELGIKLRGNTGTPYTPYNIAQSSLKANFDVTNSGVSDYTKLNTERIDPFYQIDLRVDKKYNFKKWNLDVYIDIQNLTNNISYGQPFFDVQTDAAGNKITDPNNPDYYVPKFLENTSGTIIPSIGIVVTF